MSPYCKKIRVSGLSVGALQADVSHATIRERFQQWARQPRVVSLASPSEKQAGVNLLIEAYRRFGHLNAKINPLGDNRPV